MLAHVVEEYKALREKEQAASRQRVGSLSPRQLLEFSVACDSQTRLDEQLGVAVSVSPTTVSLAPLTRWEIRKQSPHMLMLCLLGVETLTHAWVVTRQDADLLELQTVERYTKHIPRLHHQEPNMWFVSHNASKPPGLIIRRYGCAAVATQKNQNIIRHTSLWFIHSQSPDLLILRTVAWVRRQKCLLGKHRVQTFAPPNSPRYSSSSLS